MSTYKDVINVAEQEVGYLEKRSNSQLDSKTANAGDNNYTKYWRDIGNWGLGNYQAQYWCAAFVHWCFTKAYGQANAKKLLLHAPYISCATLGSKSKAAGQLYSTPKVGDIALFWNGSRFSHTELVYKVEGNIFYTIGGNTSNGSAVVANGGGVCKKQYYIDSSRSVGHRFHRPNYSGVLGGNQTVSDTKPSESNNSTSNVKSGQKWLNANYATQLNKYCGGLLGVDGDYGSKSRQASLAIWKDLMNRKHGTNLTPSNFNFLDSCKKVANKATVKVNTSGTFTYLVQFILTGKGFYTGTMDGCCGSGTVDAIKSFQKSRGLSADGDCGSNTWYALFN